MRNIIFSLGCLVAFAPANDFSQNEIKDRNIGYLGCKAYPPGHYKSCQTPNQHIIQQSAYKGFGWFLCRW